MHLSRGLLLGLAHFLSVVVKFVKPQYRAVVIVFAEACRVMADFLP